MAALSKRRLCQSSTEGHLGTQNFTSRLERFPRQIPAAKRKQVEGVEMQLGPGASMILLGVE